MFIKNQDGTIVVNTDFVFVGDQFGDEKKVFCKKGDCTIELGEYDTHERGKEVLDMICDALEDGMELIEEDSKSDQSVIRNCIFEMPIR